MDLTSYLGNSPLHCAISRGHVEVVEVLHAAGTFHFMDQIPVDVRRSLATLSTRLYFL